MKTKFYLCFTGLYLATLGTGLSQPCSISINNQPQSQANCVGTTVTTWVTADGTAPLSYRWQRSGDQVSWVDVPEATNNTIVINNFQNADVAYYRVVVTNSECSVASQAALLSPLAPPAMSSFGQPTNWPSVSLGATLTNRALATGSGPLSYQWRFNGVPLPGETKYIIILTNIQVANAGDYDVVLSNMCGSITSTKVQLQVDLTFTKINTGGVVTNSGCSWGASWGDYDNDGFADLFVARYKAGSCVTYHNNRDGTFTSVPNMPAALPIANWGSCAWADLDNDGRPDLVVSRFQGGASVYFSNANGTFGSLQLAVGAPWSIAVADFNQDGFLDILFSSGGTSTGAQLSVLYRNNGNRSFTRMTSQLVGPIVSTATFGAAIWMDYDDDGLMDLYCPDVFGLDRIFHNDQKGWFTSVNNLITRASGFLTGACGDFDNDRHIDLCSATWGKPVVLYRNLGNGEFESAATGQTISGYFQSVSCADYDNDGFLDLFLAGQGNQLHHNNGDGSFSRISTGSIPIDSPTNGSFWSYSALWFDYDNDGFLDLYVCNGNDPGTTYVPNFLYHNNGNSNAWLKIKLIGTKSNRDAVGARVYVQAHYAGQDRWQRRDISGGDGYNGNHLYAHFGLGNATEVSTLRIEWPSGVAEEFSTFAPRQTLTIVEPSLKGSLGSDSKLHVLMTMSTNRVYQLETSTNLVDWTVVTNCTGSGSSAPVEYLDPEILTDGASRYYRMK